MPLLSRPLSMTLPTLLLLGACAGTPVTEAHYRLQGRPTPLPHTVSLPSALTVTVKAPEWLDQDQVFYTLQYQDAGRIRGYTQSFWISRPAVLLEDRIRQVWLEAQATAGTARSSAKRLDIRLLDFSQQFSSPSQSTAELVAEVKLLDVAGGRPVAERLFRLSEPAAPDAPGAARALSSVSDRLIGEIFVWMEQTTTLQPSPVQARPVQVQPAAKL